MSLRRPREADAEALARLHERCWRISYAGLVDPARVVGRPWDERVAQWRGFCRGESLPMWIAEQDGTPAGFVAYAPAEVVALYVDPDRQRAGHGARLLEAACASMREGGATGAVLWTLRDNPASRGFYEAQGWRFDGAEKQEDGIDHVRYARSLTNRLE